MKYVKKAVKSGWISSKGEFIEKFEAKFSKRHGAKHGVACSSGTNALILALRAVGVKEGDEVIVPEFTMVATAWAVSMCGAKPIFVDCDAQMLINVHKIEAKITEKTVAIAPVHIYGRKANMERIMEIAHDYGLRVVEDSAEAHGTPLSGDIACFSLYGNKIITSGEGGICVTNDKYLAEQMVHLRSMAFEKDHTFLHKKLAYNFRMTNMQAAVALAQTERLDKFLAKRKEIEGWYDEELAPLAFQLGKNFRILPKRDSVWVYDIQVPFFDRDVLIEFLKGRGIESRRFFKPMSQQPMYRDEHENLVAFRFSLEGLYLPVFYAMTREQVKEVCEAIKDFYVQKENARKEKEESVAKLQAEAQRTSVSEGERPAV